MKGKRKGAAADQRCVKSLHRTDFSKTDELALTGTKLLLPEDYNRLAGYL